MPSTPNGEFTERRILLTGATGSIGSATAVRLAEAGAHVVLSGRDVIKLEKLASEMPTKSFSVSAFDLTDCESIPKWIRELAEKDGPFAGIVHAAGIYSMKPIRAVSAEFVDTMLHTNVTTGIMLGKGLRQKICHLDDAVLVLVGSTASLSGGGGNVPYAATKGAVFGATKAMAHELLRDKIRVNCVIPAMIESEMAARTREVVPPESWNAMVAHQPLGMGTPDDVAQAILYLLSPRAQWMTGTGLVLDGGLSVGS